MFESFCEKFSIDKSFKLVSGEQKFHIYKGNLKDALKYLKNTPECAFDILINLFCIDKVECFELNYILYSSELNSKVIIACEIGREDKGIETVSDLYPSANWDEREIYDLFGVTFLLHPDLKRLLMPAGWKGYPLRKDYAMDDERLNWNK